MTSVRWINLEHQAGVLPSDQQLSEGIAARGRLARAAEYVPKWQSGHAEVVGNRYLGTQYS
jgi:hypothetical protein